MNPEVLYFFSVNFVVALSPLTPSIKYLLHLHIKVRALLTAFNFKVLHLLKSSYIKLQQVINFNSISLKKAHCIFLLISIPIYCIIKIHNSFNYCTIRMHKSFVYAFAHLQLLVLTCAMQCFSFIGDWVRKLNCFLIYRVCLCFDILYTLSLYIFSGRQPFSVPSIPHLQHSLQPKCLQVT